MINSNSSSIDYAMSNAMSYAMSNAMSHGGRDSTEKETKLTEVTPENSVNTPESRTQLHSSLPNSVALSRREVAAIAYHNSKEKPTETISEKIAGYDACQYKLFAPGESMAVAPVPKKYVPDTSADFFDEIQKAMDNGVRFVLALVDIHSTTLDDIIPSYLFYLISLCKKNSIPIMTFELENDYCDGHRLPEKVSKRLPSDTEDIIKPCYSIFSSPKTHELLKKFSPDALILAGAVDEVCIKASTVGLDKDNWSSKYGAEFGATQYGYPVYIFEALVASIWGNTTTLSYKDDLLFNFPYDDE